MNKAKLADNNDISGETGLRVLIEAYECSPVREHAPGSAWQIVSRLARWHELWVLTEETQYADEVRSYLAGDSELQGRLHFSFIPRKEPLPQRHPRPIIPIRPTLNYRTWLKQALKVARGLHDSVGFDLCHHLRGDSFREPGFLWQLPMPFVWGPTGGITGVPYRLMRVMDVRSIILHVARNIITAGQIRYSPTVRRAARRSACILAQSPFDQRKFHNIHGVDALVLHEQAADPSRAALHDYDGHRALKVVWAGQCVARKGIPLLLRAVAIARSKGRIELHLVGDGPLHHAWQTEALRLGIGNQCVWHGWLSQERTLDVMRECDVLAFPSLLEATSTTTMQALSLGLPVIALKVCGLEDMVDESCGFSIPVGCVPSVIDRLAAALVQLLEDPKNVTRLSQGACRRAHERSWDQLAIFIDRVYRKAVSSNTRTVRGEIVS